MPAAKKTERTPSVGDRVRVYVDASMIDEPGEITRIGKGGEIGVHLWPDSPERVALSDVQWFATDREATAHGVRGAWPA